MAEPPTANLPMGGFKFVNVADGTVRVSPVATSLALAKVQDGGVWWGGTAGGTADALTLTMDASGPGLRCGAEVRLQIRSRKQTLGLQQSPSVV